MGSGPTLTASSFFPARAIATSPHWFTAGLPLEPLDGELRIGRRRFQRTVGIVRRQDATDLWKEARFVIFDAPGEDEDLEQRLKLVELIMEINRPAYAEMG